MIQKATHIEVLFSIQKAYFTIEKKKIIKINNRFLYYVDIPQNFGYGLVCN